MTSYDSFTQGVFFFCKQSAPEDKWLKISKDFQTTTTTTLCTFPTFTWISLNVFSFLFFEVSCTPLSLPILAIFFKNLLCSLFWWHYPMPTGLDEPLSTGELSIFSWFRLTRQLQLPRLWSAMQNPTSTPTPPSTRIRFWGTREESKKRKEKTGTKTEKGRKVSDPREGLQTQQRFYSTSVKLP